MKIVTITFKPCWQDNSGRWYSDGGFPLQTTGIGSLFDALILICVRRHSPGTGGLPLPEYARVVTVPEPPGKSSIRKLTCAILSPIYLSVIVWNALKCDAVHVPLPGDIPLLGLIAALLMRKPLLARYEGSWVENSETTPMNRITRSLLRRYAGGKNVVLATGDGDGSPAPGIRWLFSTAIGLNELAGYKPDLERSFQSPPRLAYVGRLSPEKGVGTLLKAIKAILTMGESQMPELVIMGDGPERSKLENLVSEMQIGKHVRFTGQLNRNELIKELLKTDFCVQASLTEGYSKAWLDAFACGTPVISSEVGAARAVIGGNGTRGWLVPAGNVDALANQIISVLADPPDMHALRSRCRTYVEERTLEVWVNKIGEYCAEGWSMQLINGKLTR